MPNTGLLQGLTSSPPALPGQIQVARSSTPGDVRWYDQRGPWRQFVPNEWRNNWPQTNGYDVVTSGQLRLGLTLIPIDFTLDGLGIYQGNSGAAGATWRILLYPDVNGTPGTCVVDTGTISAVTGGGTKSVTGIGYQGTRGLYWAGCLAEGITTGSPQVEIVGNVGGYFPWWSASAGSSSSFSVSAGSDNRSNAAATSLSGSQLGVPFAGTVGSGNTPIVWFRFSQVTP